MKKREKTYLIIIIIIVGLVLFVLFTVALENFRFLTPPHDHKIPKECYESFIDIKEVKEGGTIKIYRRGSETPNEVTAIITIDYRINTTIDGIRPFETRIINITGLKQGQAVQTAVRLAEPDIVCSLSNITYVHE